MPDSALISVKQLDLGSLSSVRRFAADFNRSGQFLDLLVCNAGVMAPPTRNVTSDGFEEQFQVCSCNIGKVRYVKTAIKEYMWAG